MNDRTVYIFNVQAVILWLSKMGKKPVVTSHQIDMIFDLFQSSTKPQVLVA